MSRNRLSNGEKITVERVDREVIENKLLASMSDDDKVGIVLDRADLDTLIDAIHRLGELRTAKQTSMLDDLRKLRKAAFGIAH